MKNGLSISATLIFLSLTLFAESHTPNFNSMRPLGLAGLTSSNDGRISSAEFCRDPAAYFCNRDLNPHVRDAEEVEGNLDRWEQEAEKSLVVQEYITKHRPSARRSVYQDGRCYELKSPYADRCRNLSTEIVSNKVFTRERKNGAKALFDRAKTKMVEHLKHRLEILPALKLKTAQNSIKSMIENIEGAQLYFGPQMDEPLTFNASVGPDPENNRIRNTVYLEGVILGMDTTPESVYRTLLHELSHFIDPCVFSAFDESSPNPFQKEIACLRRTDTAAAKSADLACIQKKANLLKLEGATMAAAQAEDLVEELHSHPDCVYGVPGFPSVTSSCQMNQMAEAFSDWLGTQVYASEEGNIPRVPKDFRSTTEPTLLDPTKTGAYEKIADYVSGFCPLYRTQKKVSFANYELDSHPLHEVRINAILLAHPNVKYALGCSVEERAIVRRLTDPPAEGYRAYCGMNLYAPLELGR